MVKGNHQPSTFLPSTRVWGDVGDSHKITNLDWFCHSDTFPRQARLLALFFLSGWRPAPERDRAATAIMLRRFGFFVLLRFAIAGLLLTK